MHKYKDLKVWQISVDLVMEVYKSTKTFPEEEKFGLQSQIRRCAVSIPSNIAEGGGRIYSKQFLSFLSNAYGSSCELETQLIIAKGLGYLDDRGFKAFVEKIDYIQKMIFNLKKSIERKLAS